MFEHEALRRFRQEKGYTLRQFAKLLEVSPSHLSELERGLKNPSARTLMRLKSTLGMRGEYSSPLEFTPGSDIGRRLRGLREERSISLEELAEATGLSPGYLRAVEETALVAPVADLQKIMDSLAISLDQISSNPRAAGQRVKWLRKQAGLTQAELAESAGVSPGLVAQVEQGKILPSLKTVAAIAEVLGTTPCYLISEQEDVDSVIAALPPTVRSLLLEPKVQAILFHVVPLKEDQLDFVLDFLCLLQNHLGETGSLEGEPGGADLP